MQNVCGICKTHVSQDREFDLASMQRHYAVAHKPYLKALTGWLSEIDQRETIVSQPMRDDVRVTF